MFGLGVAATLVGGFARFSFGMTFLGLVLGFGLRTGVSWALQFGADWCDIRLLMFGWCGVLVWGFAVCCVGGSGIYLAGL